MPEVDLVVVGAGQAGLVAAYTWLTLNPSSDVIILESDTCVGGVWSRNRVYPTMMTQTPVGMLEYSFLPLSPPKETFYDHFSGHYVTQYLEDFVADTSFGGKSLKDRIRFSSAVESVQRENNVWQLVTRDGTRYHCHKLIMATGPTSLPNKPSYFGESSSMSVFHSKDLQKNADLLASSNVQHVIVVGGSKSAFDVVYHLVKSGKSVQWLIRSDGQGPGLLATPDGGGLFSNSHEIISTRFIAKMSPCIFEPVDRWLWFFHQSYLGSLIRKGIFNMVNSMWQAAANYNKSPNMAKLKPDISAFWGSDNLGVQNTVDLWDVVSKATVIRDKVVKIQDKEVILSTGEKLKADALIACTGYDVSYPMFSEHDALDMGLPLPLGKSNADALQRWEPMIAAADEKVVARFPDLANNVNLPRVKPRNTPNYLYRGIIPINNQDQSIAFVGQVGSTQSLLVAEIQSLWAVAYLMDKLPLPSRSKLEEETALRIAWRRRRYLGDGNHIIYDQLAVSYISFLEFRVLRKGVDLSL